MLLTILLGLLFLSFQYTEYVYHATFGLNNIFGTVFYLTTLLHGAHVGVGIFLLSLCLIRFLKGEFLFSVRTQIGLTCAV